MNKLKSKITPDITLVADTRYDLPFDKDGYLFECYFQYDKSEGKDLKEYTHDYKPFTKDRNKYMEMFGVCIMLDTNRKDYTIATNENIIHAYVGDMYTKEGNLTTDFEDYRHRARMDKDFYDELISFVKEYYGGEEGFVKALNTYRNELIPNEHYFIEENTGLTKCTENGTVGLYPIFTTYGKIMCLERIGYDEREIAEAVMDYARYQNEGKNPETKMRYHGLLGKMFIYFKATEDSGKPGDDSIFNKLYVDILRNGTIEKYEIPFMAREKLFATWEATTKYDGFDKFQKAITRRNKDNNIIPFSKGIR